jgi:hypothetical protein
VGGLILGWRWPQAWEIFQGRRISLANTKDSYLQIEFGGYPDAQGLMSASHRLLKLMRLVHLYLGVFTAPMLLFFAITGGLQTFGLHEAARDGSYTPPGWLASLGQLHKKQTTQVPPRRPRPVDTAANGARPGTSPGGAPAAERIAQPPRQNLWPMKIFFAIVSLGLLISTLTGIYMSYRYTRKPWPINATLLAGIVVPLLLLLF